MRLTTSALLTTGLVASQAAATGWTNQAAFNCPSTANNDCDTQQKTGFDWSSLQIGDFSKYGSFGFSGYKCANSFGKRDPLTKRTFQSKCISGKLPAGGAKGPSFDCGSKKDGFSIDKYQVSVDKDTNVEFHYQMEDGSTCKHVSPCKAGGSIVQNSQCGGAKQVTVQLPKESKQDCNIGIHSIGFKCDTTPKSSSVVSRSTSVPSVVKSVASSTPVKSSSYSESKISSKSSSTWTSSATVPSSIKVSTLTPATSTATSTISSVVRITSSSTWTTSSKPESSNRALSSSTSSSYSMPAVIVSSKPVYLNSSSWSSTWSSTPSFSLVIKSSSAESSIVPITPTTSSTWSSTYSMPASSSTPETSDKAVVPTTSSTWTSSYSMPASSSTPVSSDKAIVPSSSTWTSTYSASSVSSVIKSIASPPQPSAACPDVLPKCLNTWLHNTGCKDNSDYTCFCDKPDFTKNVMDCVSSWAMDDSEVQKGLSYLAGICAAYVPKNPGLITNCPKSITIGVPAKTTPPAVIKASSDAPLTMATPYMNVTTSVLVDVTTVIATSYTTTCPAGQPITNDKGQVTTHTTPVVSTVYSTTIKTVCTKCTRVPVTTNVAAVTPLVDVTTVIATSYVTTCPAGKPVTKNNGEVTTYSTPVVSTIYSTTTSTVCTKCTRMPAMPSDNAAATPVSTIQAAVDIPVTTITVKATYTAQCTYSTGESAGFPIPGSSTATFVDTTIVAPQVAFATAAPVQGNVANAAEDASNTTPASVDLVAAATPAPMPANAATDAPVAAATTTTDAESYASMKTLASVNAGQATATTTTGKVAQFTGAAVANKAFGGLVAVAAGAAALLI